MTNTSTISLKDLCQELQEQFDDKNKFHEVSYTDCDNNTKLEVDIRKGDWKHEHWEADEIIQELLNSKGLVNFRKIKEDTDTENAIGFYVINEQPYGDSEGDTYSSIHSIVIVMKGV